MLSLSWESSSKNVWEKEWKIVLQYLQLGLSDPVKESPLFATGNFVFDDFQSRIDVDMGGDSRSKRIKWQLAQLCLKAIQPLSDLCSRAMNFLWSLSLSATVSWFFCAPQSFNNPITHRKLILISLHIVSHVGRMLISHSPNFWFVKLKRVL